jgi:uncharacterized protein with von Willebrand factor type A (vWA) domain
MMRQEGVFFAEIRGKSMIGFIFQLREAGIPVSTQFILEFFRALQQGLAQDLDRLFLLSRLIFVKKVEHYDVFEQVFASCFLGSKEAQAIPQWEELITGKPFQDWLRKQMEDGLLPPDALREFDTEELLARFYETIMAQEGEHHGGNRWIGVGGRSPYGHSGLSGGGIRVHGQGLHGTAQKVIGERRFINYSDKSTLATENLRQVLTSLKSLRPAGPETELDVDETIARTAKNGGEIELIFRRELRNRVKLIVLLDNGGYSMTPHVRLVRTVFNKIRDCFQEVQYYYFHNCIYGRVYKDPPRTQPLKWESLVNQSTKTRLVIIGDANMAPMELMAAYGSIDMTVMDRRPAVDWLKELRDIFPVSVWLNPIPQGRWMYESNTIDQIGRIFHMQDLTLAGIKKAVEYLNVQGQMYDRN